MPTTTKKVKQAGETQVTSICPPTHENPLDPCTIIIFGASGDLAARKLLPSLYNLFIHGSLPSPLNMVACSRSPYDTAGYLKKMTATIEQSGLDMKQWPRFIKNIHYVTLDYNSGKGFERLAVFVRQLDKDNNTNGNRIFYLAVPPVLYPVIAENIGAAGMSREYDNDNGWSRIVVEKPFGRDLKSARELDHVLHNSFDEHQIFRIDHYLAKETVQNILMLRFANAIFEPVWNRGYIDYIGIVAAEKLGVEHRAGYYEQAGVIRDMFQNHIMQLLALTAMEPPSIFEADRVQDEKVKVFRSLKPFSESSPEENLILGQYQAGDVDGMPVPAYRDEPEVAPQSLTPTFAMMRVFIDNWRWRGVPFYLVSGKRMARKETKIVIKFKQVPHSMFKNILGERINANRLVMGIYPEEEISLNFQTKQPGTRMCMQTVEMEFRYQDKGPSYDAYEKVLLDCMQGDHMLFWRQDGVQLSWSFLSPILADCESCSNRAELLHGYEAGSWGPEKAWKWLQLIIDE